MKTVRLYSEDGPIADITLEEVVPEPDEDPILWPKITNAQEPDWVEKLLLNLNVFDVNAEDVILSFEDGDKYLENLVYEFRGYISAEVLTAEEAGAAEL